MLVPSPCCTHSGSSRNMETRKTNSFGVQALEEVSQECFLLHLLMDSSLTMLIKIPAFLSLSHPWPSAAFGFLEKVPGYRGAESGNSWNPRKNLLDWLLCAPTGERGGSPASQQTGRGQEGLVYPRRGNHLLHRICSLSSSFYLSSVWSGEVYEPRGFGCKRSFIFQAGHKSVFVRIIKSWSG